MRKGKLHYITNFLTSGFLINLFFMYVKLVNFNFSQMFLNYDKRLAIENIFPLQIMQFLYRQTDKFALRIKDLN